MRQLACLLVMFALASSAFAQQRTGGPYVPTPQAVVDEVLRLANVQYDFGVIRKQLLKFIAQSKRAKARAKKSLGRDHL